MGKLYYLSPKVELLFVETEHGIANGSNSYVEIGPNSNFIEIEDWNNEEGFINTDYSLN